MKLSHLKTALTALVLSVGVLSLWHGGNANAAANRPFDAAAVFAKSCASCHGADGKGQTAKGKRLNATNFTDANWKAKATDAKNVKTITNGKGAMPGYKKTLSGDDINALASFVRGL